MQKLIFHIIIIIAFVFVFSHFLESKINKSKNNFSKDSLVTITISAVGDLMCHSPQFEYAKVNADSFDFNPTFKFISQYLNKSDLTFGNLETVTGGKLSGYSGYPFFNVPDEFVTAIKNAGFGLLATSNNHALDKGEKGLLRTISVINKNNIGYVGTYSSEKDRDSIRILNIKGIKIAFLAYTYGVNGNYIPKDKPYLLKLIDTVQIKKDIKKAREKGTELVFVYIHFGDEYHKLPTNYQMMIVNKTIQDGADIIIGSHPHVVEPVAFFKTIGGKLETGFVAYSLGNFISNQRWRYSDAGVILKLFITKDVEKDSIFISKVVYLPTWDFKGKINGKSEFEILPAQDAFVNPVLSFLSKLDREKMMQAFNDTKNILTKFTNQISLEGISD